MEVRLKRVYDPESPGDGFRVLVDKLGLGGIRKEAFHYDLWAKRIAPFDVAAGVVSRGSGRPLGGVSAQVPR